jgi:hypothetical protein
MEISVFEISRRESRATEDTLQSEIKISHEIGGSKTSSEK